MYRCAVPTWNYVRWRPCSNRLERAPRDSLPPRREQGPRNGQPAKREEHRRQAGSRQPGAQLAERAAGAKREGVAEVNGREQVVHGLGAPDHDARAVGPGQVLGRAGLPVVVEAHRVAVGASVMDHCDVARHRLGLQGPVDRKLVVVLAEAADDVEDRALGDDVLGVVRHCLLAVGEVGALHGVLDDGDVVVRVVHAGTHEVGHAGIDTNVVLVRLLAVDHAGDEEARRAGDVSTALRHDSNGAQALGLNHLLVDLMDPGAHRRRVDDLLARPVRNAEAAAKVNHLDLDA
mmetsp:Transcript_18131/g.47889  ORF Transcript_18131/g.47889 Transcript_18131/m.47889 type:complete len:290 (+) Transcript_18131:17-886(+)